MVIDLDLTVTQVWMGRGVCVCVCVCVCVVAVVVVIQGETGKHNNWGHLALAGVPYQGKMGRKSKLK